MVPPETVEIAFTCPSNDLSFHRISLRKVRVPSANAAALNPPPEKVSAMDAKGSEETMIAVYIDANIKAHHLPVGRLMGLNKCTFFSCVFQIPVWDGLLISRSDKFFFIGQ